MATKEFNFYICKVDRDGNETEVRNIEKHFGGCRYRYCKGLESRGEPKNIYTEDYPEHDGLRVFHPSDADGNPVHYKETEVELGLVFIGDDRRRNYNQFCDYVRSSRLHYWDNARNRKVELVLKGATTPTEDTLKGGALYIDVAFRFTNVWGVARDCDDTGNII